ncbi:alpha-methylacyl-CoA racemase [Gymnopus androsaceus JB14]|uniref:Alpha-methylacyl-CoA racemase n=1 Tax=Gymnopus androsaceus JB14 TaxID=1447944 RepID=A0A6A4IES1_9AGAR|nr:alpha-methylacyl-CoA racemase [Gymnopus androsaceus JB14]
MALKGKKVLEFAGLAPGPFAGLILADNGASVIRVDRPSASTLDVLCRGKRSVAINSKIPSGRELLKRLIVSSDILIDPFRPGVMERLGLGPDVFLGKSGLNEKLVYARIVGCFQAPRINPSFPLNLLADFAGGGMHCVTAILLALLARNETRRGQVVDIDMVSGTRYLSTSPLLHHFHPETGRFSGARGTNLLDGGAPFYNIYACKGGGLMTLACIEPRFFKIFLEKFCPSLPENFVLSKEWHGITTPKAQEDRALWPKLKQFLENGFSMRSKDEWASIFLGTDACCVPVLTPKEATDLSSLSVHPPHPTGTRWSAFDHEPCLLNPGQHTKEILIEELRLAGKDYEELLNEGVIGEHEHLK